MKNESIAEHNKKTILSKEEFLAMNADSARKMSEDQLLQSQALNLLVKADRHRWIHQSQWMGEPLLNLPQDMFAIQDIIWRTRPDFVIEVGVAWGGGMLFAATLLEILGGNKVIGIDCIGANNVFRIRGKKFENSNTPLHSIKTSLIHDSLKSRSI
jgi:cephalosporin hydroxylase